MLVSGGVKSTVTDEIDFEFLGKKGSGFIDGTELTDCNLFYRPLYFLTFTNLPLPNRTVRLC